MAKTTAMPATLGELLAPAQPTGVRNLRLEVGISMAIRGNAATIVRTVQIYEQSDNRRWRKLGPVIVADAWEPTLAAIGHELDQLRNRTGE